MSVRNMSTRESDLLYVCNHLGLISIQERKVALDLLIGFCGEEKVQVFANGTNVWADDVSDACLCMLRKYVEECIDADAIDFSDVPIEVPNRKTTLDIDKRKYSKIRAKTSNSGNLCTISE